MIKKRVNEIMVVTIKSPTLLEKIYLICEKKNNVSTCFMWAHIFWLKRKFKRTHQFKAKWETRV